MAPKGSSGSADGSSDGIALPPEWRGSAVPPFSPDVAFNGYICANVIFALEQLGLFAELDATRHVVLDEFIAERSLDGQMVRSLTDAAVLFGLVRVPEGRLELTDAGASARRMLGFFTWGVGGYHDIFAGAADLAKGDRVFGTDVLRNEAMVALGSAQAGETLMNHTLDEVIAELDFTILADLGSGTCARLCRLVGSRPEARGLGLDISASATELAEKTVGEIGLADRVRPVQADVLDVILRGQHRDRTGDVDVVMSFMFFHDLVADPRTRDRIVPELRAAFPKAHTFLIADTTLRPAVPDEPNLPVFSVGFELAHALMGVPLHTRQAYEEMFRKGGMNVRRVVPFGAPHTYLFVLTTE
ncbi:MAG: class I SAM-dependent methyltransferase [Actinocatenispora sp.]